MQQPVIEILICTIDNRIDAALRVPIAPLPNVRYLVCWQQTNQVALNQQGRVLPEREDVRIHSWNGCGLSANRIGFVGNGGPFTLMQLKVMQEAITLVIFTVFTVVFFKGESLHWNHFLAFLLLIGAVYFVFLPTSEG